MSWFASLLVGVGACGAPRATDGRSALPGTTMIAYAELTATPAPPANHRESYGTGALQFGELRLPRGRSRAPVVVLIHGGCWRAAYDLAHVGPAAAALADAGYAVWVPEYRRVGDDGGGWPGTFDDIAGAVDFVRELSARYAVLDTTRVVLVGHSAGAQLALWAAARRPGDTSVERAAGARPARKPPLRAVGVVSLAGITDLTNYASANGCGSAVVPLLGGTAAQVAERYRAASPIDRIPIGVPMRLVHGVADPIVPFAQVQEFASRAKAAGDAVTLSRVAGAGHFDVVAPQAAAWSAVLEAVRAVANRGGR
jgi:acetyl esterase/lipase